MLGDEGENAMVRHEAAEALGSIADEARVFVSLTAHKSGNFFCCKSAQPIFL